MTAFETKPSAADPRPRVAEAGPGELVLLGATCSACGHHVAYDLPRCPACRGATRPARFAAAGIVWSATVLHVSVQEREVPYALAYVDLDDGPRVLVHVPGRPRVGARVTLRGTTAAGDLEAAELEQEAP